jgi:hypothetical protein
MATMTTIASGRVGPKTGTNSDLAEERIQVRRFACAPQTLRRQVCFNASPPSCVCVCVCVCACVIAFCVELASPAAVVSSHIVRTLHGALDTVNMHPTHRRDAHSASRPVACTGHAYADVAWSWLQSECVSVSESVVFSRADVDTLHECEGFCTLQAQSEWGHCHVLILHQTSGQ